jgi:hypothetical protein
MDDDAADHIPHACASRTTTLSLATPSGPVNFTDANSLFELRNDAGWFNASVHQE